MKKVIQIVGAVVAGTMAQSAGAADIRVPADYPSIQAAVDAAAVGDRVVVDPGNYAGFDFRSKNVTVISVGGFGVTNLTSTVNMTTGVLQGFAIQASYATGVVAVGGGTIRQCRMHDNHKDWWGIWRGLGMQLRGPVLVQECIVENNSGGVYTFGGVAGAGIYVGPGNGGTTVVERTVIRNNAAAWYYGPSGGGVAIGFQSGSSESGEDGATVVFRRCVIYGNSSGGCDQIKNYYSSCTLEDSFVVGSYCGGIGFVGASQAAPAMIDCNGNGVPDQWDSISGSSLDVNADFVPDECQLPDTDLDGIPNIYDNCPGIQNHEQADCDHDGIGDVCEIAAGTATDFNHNGIPDTCECLGDILGDGRIDGADLGAVLSYWGPATSSPTSQACDIDKNGVVNGADLGILLSNWGTCSN
jgi:hypothetical protein